MDDYLVKLNVALVFICLIGLVVIISLIIHINGLSNEINNELINIDKKFPECPDCNTECPPCNTECPPCDTKCPDVTCPENKECPPCPTVNVHNTQPEVKNIINESNSEKESNLKTDKTKYLENNDCPTVKEIVSGIFPGRNPKVVDGGRYFNIDPYNTYDGLSTSNFYEQNYKFPIDKILRPDPPLRSYNIGGEELINNSVENKNVNTNTQRRMSKDIPVPFNFHSPVNYLESTHNNEEYEPAMNQETISRINSEMEVPQRTRTEMADIDTNSSNDTNPDNTNSSNDTSTTSTTSP